MLPEGISETLTTVFKVDKLKRVKRRKANLVINILVNLMFERVVFKTMSFRRCTDFQTSFMQMSNYCQII